MTPTVTTTTPTPAAPPIAAALACPVAVSPLPAHHPVKRRVTINLSVYDARNLAGHLRETTATNEGRAKSIQFAQRKLMRQIGQCERITAQSV